MSSPTRHGERRCYLRGCRRVECCTANRRYLKRYRTDRIRSGLRRVDAGPAAQHIDALVDDGWSQGQIAAAADCSRKAINDLCNRAYKTIHADLAQQVLAARPTLASCPSASYVDATGARRRFQALMAIGHTKKDIARGAGISRTTCTLLIADQKTRLTAENALALVSVYHRWAVAPGSNVRARLRAMREGWPSPAAWGENIDDPAAIPDADGEVPELGRDQLADLRREEIAHLASFGIPEQEIADRLGMSPAYVHDLVRDLRASRKQVGT